MRKETDKYYIRYNLSWKHWMVSVMALAAMAMPVLAQNNEYKINDQLYPLYVRAHTARRTQQGLLIADTLYHRAILLKDKKAQCLALTIPFLYQFYQKDRPTFEKRLKELQDKAIQTGYVQYYYFGVLNKVNYLLNEDHWTEALDYTNDMLAYAKKHNHKYGIYVGYRSLGLIQFQRNATRQAIDAFHDAIKFGQEFLPEQDMAPNYRSIADAYKLTEDYGNMLDNVEKGLKIAKSTQTRNSLIMLKCYALFMLGREQEFLKYYDEAVKAYGLDNKASINTSPLKELQVFKCLIDGNYPKAMELIGQIEPESQQMVLKVVYYNRIGDFKKAQECLHKQFNMYKLRTEQVSTDALTEMNARLNNQRLESEKQQTDYKNTKLELANTRLTLQNSSLELGQAKAAEHLARLNADNYQLSYNNKQLEARRLRDSLEAQKAKREAEEKEMKTHNMTLRILLAVAIIILALTFIYIYNVRRIARKLNLSNHHLRKTISELFVAKDKALQADKMKTMFIQNMSHEIRTPLNAIVGFSQLLAEMGDSLGEEEKKEMSESIINNSDLLTTLINDILDITALESGRYVMKMEMADVAQICRQALDTVAHRKAPGVELKLNIETPAGYQVNTDANRVKQVLINMLTNAEKNTSQGHITLSCSLHEVPGKLTFSVEDTGIGIPPEKMDEIFERFKKLDRYKQGSGLGLNICRTIAEKLGGDIRVDKNYTGGARFLFTIQDNASSGGIQTEADLKDNPENQADAHKRAWAD